MKDYKETMMILFQRNYSTTGEEWQMKKVSTMYVHAMFMQLIPSEPITEHDVFEVLDELGYQIVLETLYDKVCIFEGNEKEGREPEYDMVEAGKVYKWVIFEK